MSDFCHYFPLYWKFYPEQLSNKINKTKLSCKVIGETISICKLHDTIHRGKQGVHPQKHILPKLINKFSKVAEYKITTNKLCFDILEINNWKGS